MTSYYDGYPLLVHHTMVGSILREFANRTNRDQRRMLTWNGVQIEGAEDFYHGVQSGLPETPRPRVDWELLHKVGELQERVTKHPNKKFLKVPRMFFNNTPTPAERDYWIETPDYYETDTLDMFTPDTISFDNLLLHIECDGEQPLFFSVVKALRRMQNVLKSPVYHYVEVEDGGAPKMMEDAFDNLEPESANRLTTGEDDELFESAVNLDLVADFLIAKRAFKEWLEASRQAKEDLAASRRAEEELAASRQNEDDNIVLPAKRKIDC
jgi:hypothetical protein